MRLKLRLINKKWLQLEIETRKKSNCITYWGGFKFSSSVIYSN